MGVGTDAKYKHTEGDSSFIHTWQAFGQKGFQLFNMVFVIVIVIAFCEYRGSMIGERR